MAKKINLPKATVSSKGDLITITQGGVEKSISKEVLLKYLEDSMGRLSSDINSLQSQIRAKTINKSNPSFPNAVSAKSPSSPSHLTTKSYVDNSLHNVVKNDGSTQLIRNLSFRSAPSTFSNNDIVTRKFVDDSLKSALKTIRKISGNDGYPQSSVGDTYMLENTISVFATDGPEVQKGDLLICIENSKGGTHGASGQQFAIINTNVVFATEEAAGILRVASEIDIAEMSSEDSAVTPFKLKRSLESGSSYNRTIIDASTYNLAEVERGIIGVNTLNRPVTINLPSIGRAANSKILKYTIKDESNNASKNTITIVATGGDTIQGSRSYIISGNSESIKLYNNGENIWYLESNVASGASGTGGMKSFTSVTGEKASSTGAYESVMSIDVDLKEYPIGTGFKVVAHSITASNGQTKTVAIGVNGTQLNASSLTGVTAPDLDFIHHELTVIRTNSPSSLAYGFVLVGINKAAPALSNTLNLDWNSIISVSVDVNNATAASDVTVYSLQVIPLK